jgi:hypothetical protein
MTRYIYSTDHVIHEFETNWAEAKMLVHLAPFPQGQPNIPNVSYGRAVRVERAALLSTTAEALENLRCQDNLLQFIYGTATTVNGRVIRSPARRGVRREPYLFKGKGLLLNAGQGYCQLGSWRWGLHDLRNMTPIVLDDGSILQATRYDSPCDVVARIGLLLQDLRNADSDVVEIVAKPSRRPTHSLRRTASGIMTIEQPAR